MKGDPLNFRGGLGCHVFLVKQIFLNELQVRIISVFLKHPFYENLTYKEFLVDCGALWKHFSEIFHLSLKGQNLPECFKKPFESIYSRFIMVKAQCLWDVAKKMNSSI